MLDINEKDIVILGHANPDSDSIISGYLMEKLLNNMGLNARFIIPDMNIEQITMNICSRYDIDIKRYQGDIPCNSNIILVDHYKRDIDGKIIFIIDHHPTIEKLQCDNYVNKASSSTAKLIYDLKPEIFDKHDIELVVIANLVDTVSFLSTKTVKSDIDWTIEMCKKYELDYDKLYEEGLCLTDLSDINKSYLNGMKHYNYNGNDIKSSYIQVKSVNEDTIKILVDLCKRKKEEENLFMWVFIVQNVRDLNSTVYLIRDNIEVIKYDFLASRGNLIMPNIEKEIMSKK